LAEPGDVVLCPTAESNMERIDGVIAADIDLDRSAYELFRRNEPPLALPWPILFVPPFPLSPGTVRVDSVERRLTLAADVTYVLVVPVLKSDPVLEAAPDVDVVA
jgi:hypothetical protein